MVIGIFHPLSSIGLNDAVMKAVQLGFLEKERDAEIVVSRKENYIKCSVAIRWGIPSRKHAAKTNYRRLIDLKHSGYIGIIELGWLGDRSKHFQFGFNGLSGRGRYFMPDAFLAEERFNRLGITIPKQREKSKHDYILLCGQVPWDTSIQHLDYLNHFYGLAKDIKENTNLPCVFRPHPKSLHTIPWEPLAKMGYIYSMEPLAGALKRARCVATVNSNVAVDALLAGTPALTLDEGSMVYDITTHNVERIDDPPFPSEDLLYQRLVEIANSQWTIEEFYENLPWQIAKEQLYKNG